MSARVDGVLVAGGRSRRFGRDKRHEVFGGLTLAEHSLALLRQCTDGVVFIAGHGAFLHPVQGIAVADAAIGAGPLGAIVAALSRSEFGVMALPCDAPLLRPDSVKAVVQLGRHRSRTVVLRSACGPEPLVAFYPRSALPLLAAALRGGHRALHRLLPRLRALEVKVGAAHELHNVNRPEDLESATAWGTPRSGQGTPT